MPQDDARRKPDEPDRRPPSDRIPPEEHTERDPPPSPRDPHGPHTSGTEAGQATDTGTGPAHHPPPPDDTVPPSPRDPHGPHAGRPVDSKLSGTINAVYILYLIGIFVLIAIPIGAVIAFVKRGKAGPVEHSHYLFQIQTFFGSVVAWLLAGIIAALTPAFVPVAWLIMLALAFWIVIRSVKGMAWAGRAEPVPSPTDWKFGGGGTSRPDAGSRRPPP